MTSSDLRRALPLWIPVLAAACGGSGPRSPGQAPGVVLPAGPNVLAVSVDGSGCAASAYLNEPCVAVTVCVPGTSTCQRVGGLLLDTGSTGLRVFSQALTLNLPAATAGGANVGECMGYVDGAKQWGQVVEASVVLGGEPAVDVPIQLIDAGFPGRPTTCAGAQADPSLAGYNGILGVSSWQQDCGPGCATSARNGMYYACTGAGCTGTAMPLQAQVQNPVAALPVDGNGLLVRLPAVPSGGAASAAGALVLGIGTRDNNVPPASVLAFPLDGLGELQTTIGGATTPAFLDTGSNGLFFPSQPAPGLVPCTGPDAGWFCPLAPVTVDASDTGAGGSPTAPVRFEIASIATLGPSVGVSAEVGGLSAGPGGVDWGLPFHLGRDVYVGMEGRASGLGTGPYVAW